MKTSRLRTAEGPRETTAIQLAWQPLRYFGAYRTVLAALFTALLIWGNAPQPLGQYDFGLFQRVAIAYFLFAVAASTASFWQWPSFSIQVAVQVIVDIVALTLMMHASGGVSSGLGILLVVAIAGGSILTSGRTAVLFAALASIAILLQQVYVGFNDPFATTNYPHVGMLGTVLFATAFVAHRSATRIRSSEALAARRGFDLANLAQLNEHIIQRMQSGILVLDAQHRIRLINESARQFLGLSARNEGERLSRAVPELHELVERWYEDDTQAAHLVQPAGVQITVQASLAAIGAGASKGVLIFLEDASAMTQRAHHLKLAALGRLTASIAHEIRNPLSAVSHANQLLWESLRADEADRRLIRIIRDNALRMNTIVENVLQLSRGKRAAPVYMNLRPWLERFVAEFRDQRSVSPESVRLVVTPVDLQVSIDPSQLHQILSNLCQNALQHAKGTPRVELRAGVADETERPYLDVWDNGDGVSAEDAERVFEPFFTTRAGGTGLGLYIARELCEGNQATLSHMPTESGCCFRITFCHPRRQVALVA